MKNITKALTAVCLVFIFQSSPAKQLHFLIPAGPGGGLDSTARAIGETLLKAGVTERVSYENRTGGGGARALSYFVTSKSNLKNTLLINSTPLLIRSIRGKFKQSHNDVVPVASLIADPAVIAVKADSIYPDWYSLLGLLKTTPKRVAIGGGSVRGSLDHIALALLLKSASINPRKVQYIPYDGGGKALLGLLSSETQVLVSGLGESIAQHKAGTIKIIGISSAKRIKEIPEIPTFNEMDVDVVFSNWRGLFASKSLSFDHIEGHRRSIKKIVNTNEWQSKLNRYGWEPFYLNGDEFKNFLTKQETVLRKTLLELKLI
jgi:putative tricarboxylic transport membrane protein